MDWELENVFKQRRVQYLVPGGILHSTDADTLELEVLRLRLLPGRFAKRSMSSYGTCGRAVMHDCRYMRDNKSGD